VRVIKEGRRGKGGYFDDKEMKRLLCFITGIT
jgi:hypothetical protein